MIGGKKRGTFGRRTSINDTILSLCVCALVKFFYLIPIVFSFYKNILLFLQN